MTQVQTMNSINWLSQLAKIILLFPLILPLVAFGSVPSSAQGLEAWNKPCLKDYKKWKGAAKHKSFAVSNSNAGGVGGQSCGSAYGYPTKASAEAAAIKSCESNHYGAGRCYVTKSE